MEDKVERPRETFLKNGKNYRNLDKVILAGVKDTIKFEWNRTSVPGISGSSPMLV